MAGIRTPEQQAIDLWGVDHQKGKLGEEAGEVASAAARHLNAIRRNDPVAISKTGLHLDLEVSDLKRLIRQYEMIRGEDAMDRADQVTSLRFLTVMAVERQRRLDAEAEAKQN